MKKIFLGIVIPALAIAAFVWYQWQDIAPVPDIAPAEEDTKQLVAAPAMAGTESFRTLMAKAGDLECTITTTGTDAVTGSYFASKGRFRVDVGFVGVATTTSFSNVTSMILSDQTLYTWAFIDGESYGVKSVFAESAASAAQPEPGKQTPIDFDGQVTYDCKPWEVVDNSIFTPPSTILFKDYEAAMEAGMEDGTIYPEGQTGPTLTPEDMQSGDPCALCDKVAPGEGQDQCRVNFKCEG